MPNSKAGLAILAPAQTELFRSAVAELVKIACNEIAPSLALASTGLITVGQATLSFKDGEAVYLRKPGKGDGSGA
eukprot:3444279-Pyramimonas_sp.AAC.1